LDKTQIDLRTASEERDRAQREKEMAVSELQQRMQSMALAYEALVHETVENMAGRLRAQRDRWQDSSAKIQARNKQALLEFGLKPLDF
jgi:two-component sensor histidine kinase